MSQHPASCSDAVVRPLLAADLNSVVALDRSITGSARRSYFEKRLLSALRKPKRHLQIAVTSTSGKLIGFLLARQVGGEFGRQESAVVLESISVDPAARHCGLGQRLLSALVDLLRARNVQLLILHVDWRNHAMLRFAASAGFVLGSRLLLERPVQRMSLPDTEAILETTPKQIRSLREADLDAVVQLDRALTKHDRSEYFQRKFDEVLNESAISMSLAAECNGQVVAYAMARVDFGSEGHVEPTAALHTIGVAASHAGQGFGVAILSELIDNLAALHVEHIETEVSRDSFGLLRFLYRFGFVPSQRLMLQRTLD
jgi:ribosomal protein S18 acetylase RimI-like enzyme